ncbi:response regulator transcription factor [Clostridium sp. MSJ-11]|uniref:Response regulator transcription factor n=1 Tax=Clostridium mobile TaxID=2841512 RepID=A0ABS6EL40_9CLOT|nr:response regulator transcription factor [Clostridium mobile]MBU5485927.1 response regulator transcription factor [Clostridium mobile]
MKRILLIEDDETIRGELSIVLENHGYSVYAVTDFPKVINEIKEQNPHLILLDINLPCKDGFKLCTQIRSFSTVPIIFVTSRNTDMDELSSITLGGDDYITKPYNISILLARIDSLLKRAYGDFNEQYELRYRDLKLCLDVGEVEYRGKCVELTKNEMKILYYLFKHNGKIVSRADIIEYLWDNKMFVDDNTLSVNITRIRNKLAEIGIANFIITKHGQGYMI